MYDRKLYINNLKQYDDSNWRIVRERLLAILAPYRRYIQNPTAEQEQAAKSALVEIYRFLRDVEPDKLDIAIGRDRCYDGHVLELTWVFFPLYEHQYHFACHELYSHLRGWNSQYAYMPFTQKRVRDALVVLLEPLACKTGEEGE